MAEMVYDPKLPVAYVNGCVVPIGKRGVTAVELLEGMTTELMADYEGKDPKKFGLTKKQAYEKALVDKAADGDLAAINILLDRILGKPLQQVQSLNVTTNLKDFLNGLINADSHREASPF